MSKKVRIAREGNHPEREAEGDGGNTGTRASASANPVVVALNTVFGPLVRMSADWAPPFKYGLPLIVAVMLIALLRPAVPANLVWLLALLIVAPTAGWIVTLVIAQKNPSPQICVAEIKYPTVRNEVNRTIDCFGWAVGIPEKNHLWLAVEERNGAQDLIWPKEGEIVVNNGQWSKKIFERGMAGEFSILLFMADEQGDKRIRDWLEEGKLPGHGYPGLTGIPGTSCMDRVDELRLAEDKGAATTNRGKSPAA